MSKALADFMLTQKERADMESASAKRQLKKYPIERPFLSYDGEAVDNKFVLLANTKHFVYDSNGLSTAACLRFLDRYEDGNPIRISFAFEYDITMILKDVEYDDLKRLMDTGNLVWGGYEIQHIPRRIFRINRVGMPKNYAKVYYDTWAYFQSSFLKTISEYAPAIGLTDEEKTLIEWGKGKRDEFHQSDMRDIQKYNSMECSLLDRTLEVLRKAANHIGWKSRAWYGPGTFAELFLQELHANDYRAYDVPLDAVNSARYGGRIELLQRGCSTEILYDYDINSAYPWAMSTVPNVNGKWEYKRGYYEPERFGIYKVSWNCDNCVVGPLPFRDKDARVYFPPRGQGVYHAVELDAAISVYGLSTSPERAGIFVEESWLLEDDRTRPFKQGIEARYEQRGKLKSEGSFSQIAIKLGLNATYGKLAQRIGARKHVNLLLSGYITAATRAKLLRATAGNEAAIVSFATDGIVSRIPLELPISKRLGDWEVNTSEGGDFYLPGIYRLKHDEWMNKFRGFYGLDFDELPYKLHNNPVGTPITQRIFVPYRLAVFAQKAYWPRKGQFIDITKQFNPNSGHKRFWQHQTEWPAVCWTVEWQTSIAAPIGEWNAYPDYPSQPPTLKEEQEEWREGDNFVEESLIVSSNNG